MAAGSIRVTPEDLHGAAGTLTSVRGELGTETVAGSGGTGSGAMDGALGALSARLDFVAQALDNALGVTGQNLAAGAATYESTDTSQFRSGDAGP
jgi:hypothetical protein